MYLRAKPKTGLGNRKYKLGALCSGSDNSAFGSRCVDQSALVDLALQDLIYAMHLEYKEGSLFCQGCWLDFSCE